MYEYYMYLCELMIWALLSICVCCALGCVLCVFSVFVSFVSIYECVLVGLSMYVRGRRAR